MESNLPKEKGDIKTPEEILSTHPNKKIAKNYWEGTTHISKVEQWYSMETALSAIKEYHDQFKPQPLPDNPYPESVFPPLSDKQFDDLVEYCRERGFPIDRLSAHIGRMIYAGLVEKFKPQPPPEDVKEYIEKEADKLYPKPDWETQNPFDQRTIAAETLKEVKRTELIQGFNLCYSTYVIPLQSRIDFIEKELDYWKELYKEANQREIEGL